MRGLAFAFVAMLAITGQAQAERLTIALSTTDIAVNSSFTGVSLTVFGVIEGDNGAAPAGDYGVAVLVLGPRYSVVARKKDRVLGIWANREAQTIINPPSYYALSTSTPIAELASASVLERLQLGLDNIAFVYEARATVNDPGAAEFRDAYVRLKQKARLFSQDTNVGFIGNLVFRSTAWLPASIPVGDYTAVAYLFSSGELIARAEQKISVSRTGAEATLADFARTQALPYGVLVVTLALIVGWVGGVVFRRD